MSRSWQSWCEDGDLRVVADGAEVFFPSGRAHVVRVTETDSAIQFSAIVGMANSLPASYASALSLWQQNRALPLAGLHLDRQGKVCVRSWVAKAGLTPVEFRGVVTHVAREADRLEHLLTGADDS